MTNPQGSYAQFVAWALGAPMTVRGKEDGTFVHTFTPDFSEIPIEVLREDAEHLPTDLLLTDPTTGKTGPIRDVLLGILDEQEAAILGAVSVAEALEGRSAWIEAVEAREAA